MAKLFKANSAKSQSAMEYLMTYGWAILIIAVVLGALFQLGVFSGIGTPKAQAGNCQVVKVGTGITQTISLAGECQGQEPEFVVSFNGLGSYIIQQSASTYTSNNYLPLSISLWIYPTNSTGTVLESTSSGPNGGVDFFVVNGGNLGVSDYRCIGTSNPNLLNKWTNVIYTFNGVYATVYINGARAIGDPDPPNDIRDGSFMVLGGMPNPTTCGIGASFSGMMANYQIYDTSLSSGEAAALYREGIGGAPINPQSIIGWWPLNGNFNDYSGNNDYAIGAGVKFTSTWTSGYTVP